MVKLHLVALARAGGVFTFQEGPLAASAFIGGSRHVGAAVPAIVVGLRNGGRLVGRHVLRLTLGGGGLKSGLSCNELRNSWSVWNAAEKR